LQGLFSLASGRETALGRKALPNELVSAASARTTARERYSILNGKLMAVLWAAATNCPLFS
jgi:hypothetical protein